MKKRKVAISPDFDKQFDEFYEYIYKESPQNAEKFVRALEKNMKLIEKNPEAYPPVTNFPNKTKRYRYKIFMKSFKIVYKCLKEVLIFVGLLHTSQGYKAYQNLRKTKYD
jgi:plasmid stabilization system protein ParE